ncbi:Uncharacterised protein [Mycobacteroides abscessus subsp. abscessus]|nr:Uncharacterised protein [Mycobacteroides abscessus subsp. abscessus]
MAPYRSMMESNTDSWVSSRPASNSTQSIPVAPASSIRRFSSRRSSARRAANTTVLSGANRVATSSPISLRPPKITTVDGLRPSDLSPSWPECRTVSVTSAIMSCASVRVDAEHPYNPTYR